MKTGVWSIAGVCRKAVACTLGASLSLSLSPARADAVAEWHAIAAGMAASSPPPRAARELAAVHVAMFETMNFVEGKYVPAFLVRQPAPLAASSEAQAIGAAHYVLAQLYPERQAALDAALERSLAAFADREGASRARVWGRELGRAVYTVFASDGFQVPANGALPGASGEAWHAIAARSLDGRALQPIERARIYALLALAAREAHRASEIAGTGRGPAACASCAVGTAIRVVLKAEIGWADEGASAAQSPGDPTGTETGLRMLSYYRRIR
jgi:hypothetical protein